MEVLWLRFEVILPVTKIPTMDLTLSMWRRYFKRAATDREAVTLVLPVITPRSVQRLLAGAVVTEHLPAVTSHLVTRHLPADMALPEVELEVENVDDRTITPIMYLITMALSYTFIKCERRQVFVTTMVKANIAKHYPFGRLG